MRALHRGGVALGVMAALVAPSTAAATTTSQSFTTPGENVFVVPPAVTSLQMTLVGGHGGNGSTGALGGVGATEIAALAVVPGETLYAEVGGDGGNADTTGNGLGGTNGGGAGGSTAFGGLSGAGGGGASDVRTLSASSPGSLASRLVVAGGGGGGAGGGLSGGGHGGNGGASDANGFDGAPDTYHDAIGTAGARGTPSAGGAAGTGTSTAPAAAPGVLGIGGGGGGEDLGGGGGGGGGGIYGGGGGGDATGTYFSSPTQYIVGSGGGGGGGGASTIPSVAPAGVSNLSLIPTATGAEPQITFTWTVPPPTASTAAPSGISAHKATLAGTVNPNASPVTGCYFTITPTPPGGPTLSCAQQLQSGTTPVPVSAQLSGLTPSTRYTVQLVAIDAEGTSTGGPVSFTTWPPPPTISALNIAKTLHRGSARHPNPARFSLRISQPAKTIVQFARLKGHRWVSLAYVLAAQEPAGKRTITFSTGRLGLGHFRMSVSATNAYGETSSVQRAAFRVAR